MNGANTHTVFCIEIAKFNSLHQLIIRFSFGGTKNKTKFLEELPAFSIVRVLVVFVAHFFTAGRSDRIFFLTEDRQLNAPFSFLDSGQARRREQVCPDMNLRNLGRSLKS